MDLGVFWIDSSKDCNYWRSSSRTILVLNDLVDGDLSSLWVGYMVFKLFKRTSRNELLNKCATLKSELKKKHEELQLRKAQTKKLSGRVKRWTAKYNELKASFVELKAERDNELEVLAKEQSTKTQQLQLKLIKLSKQNKELQTKLDLLMSSQPKQTKRPRKLVADGDEPEFSIEMQQSLSKYTQSSA